MLKLTLIYVGQRILTSIHTYVHRATGKEKTEKESKPHELLRVFNHDNVAILCILLDPGKDIFFRLFSLSLSRCALGL